MAFANLGKSIGEGLDGISSVFSGLGLANEENETVMMTPDRQNQLGAGAFLSVSQQSVSPQVTGRHQNQRTESSFDAPASMETQGERFFVIDTGVWTTTDQRFVEVANIYLPSVFNNPKMSVFGQLAYHAYIRSDFEIQVMINATNFQQGSILCVAVPHWACVDDQGNEAWKMSYTSMLTLPHALLNCNVNNSGAFGFPWLHTRNMKSIHYQPRDIWCVKIIVWSPLMVATGTSTRVSYRVLGRLKNLELHGLRPFHAQMMRMIVAPGMGAFNTSNSEGTTPSYDMSLGPENFPTDATMAGGLEVKDLGKQILTPCFLGAMTMSTVNQHQGYLLGKFEIGPEMEPQQYHGIHHPTNLHALSKFYRYWRGDMMVIFQVMCTKFHSGRVMVSFVPEITKEMTFEDHMSSSVLMFDINGVSSTAKFRVPFMSETMYRPTNSPIGLLTIWVLNELTAPETVSHTVEIVVMIAGAENFGLFAPTWDETAQGETEGEEQLEPEEAPKKIDAASVVEDPHMLISNTGTFPEIAPGKRTHTKPHTDISVILGRMRMMQAIAVTTSGAGRQAIPIRFTTNNGPLRGLLRFGYLLRGTLRVAIVISNGAAGGEPEAALRAGFFPDPMPEHMTWDRFTSVGFVSFNTVSAQTVVMKIPWYTNLAAINLWGGPDVNFGHLYIDWFTSRAMSIDIMVSMSDDTQLLFPMGAQISENYPMRTRKKAVLGTIDMERDVVRVEGEGRLGVGIRAIRGPTMEESGIFIVSLDKHSPLRELGVRTGDMIEAANVRSLIGLSRTKAVKILRDERPVDLMIMKGAASYYGITFGQKTTHRVFLEEFEEESDEEIDPGKQEEETASISNEMTPMSFEEDLDYVAQGGEFEVGDLISRTMQYGMKHYAVYIGGGTIIELCPDEEKKMPVFANNGMVEMNPLEEGDNWKCEGHSPDPEIAFRAAVSWLGQAPYDLVRYNCESFARSVTMVHATHQVDKVVMVGACVSGAMLAGSLITTGFIAHAGDDKQKDKVGFFQRKALTVINKSKITNDATAVIQEVDKEVKMVTGKANALIDDIKEQLDPSKIFEHIGKRKLAKWGAKLTAFILDTVATVCEIVAICTTKDNNTRMLLMATFGARAAAQVLQLVMTIVDTMSAQMNPFEPFEETDELDEPIFQDVFKEVVNQQWEKNMGSEFTPQGGIMVLARNFTTIHMALKSIDGFTGFCKDLIESFLAWLKPRTKDAMDWKRANKAGKEFTQLSVQWSKIAVLSGETPEGRAQKNEKARALLVQTQELMEAIKKNYDKHKHGHIVTSISNLQSKILKVISESKSGASSSRTEPVVMYMTGKPGAGKSISANAFAYALCLKLGLDPEKHIYSKPVDAEFWDGYTGQNVMIIDDVGQATDGEDWTNMCQIVSAAPMKLNMANLEEKGAEFKTPYIIMTSNDPLPKPNTISDHGALYRRLSTCVLVKPHDAYKTEGGLLNISLAKEAGALKSMQCCVYQPYIIKTNKTGTTVTETQEAVSFLNLLNQFHDSYINKMALTGHMKLMMREIFPQGGEEVTFHRSTSQVDFNDVEEEAKRSMSKQHKKVLMVVGVATAIVGALGLIGCIAAVVTSTKRKSVTTQRAYNPATRDTPRKPGEMVAQRHVEVSHTTKNNMVRVGKQTLEKRVITGQAVFVYPTVMVCVNHCVEGVKDLIIEDASECVTLSEEEYVIEKLEGDLVAICLKSRKIRPRRNLAGLIVSEGELGRVPAGHAVVYTCTNHVLPMTALRENPEFSYPDPNNKGQRITVSRSFKGVGTAMVGVCGSPWISTVTSIGCRIFGIHVAGSDTHSVCQTLTREMIEKYASWEPQGKILRVEKSDVKVNSAGPTKIEKTTLHPYVECTKTNAPMGWWDPLAENDPEAQIMMKHIAPTRVEPADWYVTEMVTLGNGADLKEKVSHLPGPVLSFREAVEGIVGLEGVDMNTSAGLPWSQRNKPEKRKKKYLLSDPEFLDEVKKVADYILNPFAEMEKPEIKYSVHLKDETISIDKAKAGRTRFIAAAPFHLVLGARMCFGRAVSIIHRTMPLDDSAYGIAVGMNPEKDFTYLALRNPDWRVLAVDYKNFDGSIQKWVLESACRVLADMNGLPLECGNRFAEFVVTSRQICNNQEFLIDGALPSGAPFTSVLGSLCNYMMLMYTMSRTSYLGMHRFTTYCAPVTYGDDVLMRVDPELEFDADEFATAMYQYFGATATDAVDKNDAPQLRDLEDITFLKRGFRRCSQNTYLTHPVMCEGTIMGLLAYKKRGATYQELVRNAVGFIWHHGREPYQSFCSMMHWIAHAIPESERLVALSELVPYDELHDNWMNNP